MNLYEAKHLARSLMDQHGLAGWSFAFDSARRRFGCCIPQLKRITLSRALTLLNGLDEVRDTILHEIAHALTPGEKHGEEWKATCRRIGARPTRCYTHETVLAPPRPPALLEIGCPRCGWWVERHRLAWRRALACRKCRLPVLYRDKASGKCFVIERGRTVVVDQASASGSV